MRPKNARLKRARIHQHKTHKPNEPVWLFDLDNTLHNTSHRIFEHISAGMTAAVRESLNVDDDQAQQLRRTYWKRYGATVIGMVKHHGVDPHVFLRRSHDFDVVPLVQAERGIHRKLAQLKGRKVMVTNAPLHYAVAVLKHLRMHHLFNAIWAIEHLKLHGQYRPKPSVAIMRHIVACEGVAAYRTVLIEDTLENLKGARAAGLRTVHVFHPGTPFAKCARGRSPYVDMRIKKVSDLLLSKRSLQR
jgi:putative hydrolase of the HAD superfamily